MCDLLRFHLWNEAHPSCSVPKGCVFKLCPRPSSCICRSLDFAQVPPAVLFCLPWAHRRCKQVWNIGTLNLNQHLSPALKCIRVQCFLKSIRKTQFPPQCLPLCRPLSQSLPRLPASSLPCLLLYFFCFSRLWLWQLVQNLCFSKLNIVLCFTAKVFNSNVGLKLSFSLMPLLCVPSLCDLLSS